MCANYIRSGKRKERIKKLRYFRCSLAVVFVVVLFIGLSFWSRHSSVTISGIEILGIENVDENMVRNDVVQELQGSHMGLFSRKNVILIPRQEIKRTLYTSNPAFEKVDVYIRDKKLYIHVKEHTPVALWCADGSAEAYIENIHHELHVSSTSGRWRFEIPHTAGKTMSSRPTLSSLRNEMVRVGCPSIRRSS